ncbi:preprotein translocase subunit SecG [uncultured Parolsenella sp.]|uniref:preprotein translocase subunit SecG n=1 Tax=uncultured Parolsenella sp. TaxID=2083008 RepID=UPI00259718BC|nr:preprotein translocase subunit SecG [uncultured Parolsenella sp.]
MSQRSPFNKRNQPQTEDEKKSSSGITRKSPTKAKPVREAASSVRVVAKKKNPDGSTSTAGMTKEEKKEVRRAEREEEDIFNSLTNAMLKADELYTSRRRMWWVFLGLGLVFVVAAFASGYIGAPDGSNMYDLSTTGGVLSVVSLVLAYVFIITSLVYEWMKIRPIRNEKQNKVASLSPKKRRAMLADLYEASERKRAEKKSAK